MSDITLAASARRPFADGIASRLAGHPMALAALALACVVLLGQMPTVLMRTLGLENGLWFLKAWWTGPYGGDSWLPIGHAQEVMAQVGPPGFYQGAYYDTHSQFIYPPLSLVFFDLTTWPGVIEWGNQPVMNRLSWWLTLICAGLTAAILAVAPRRLGLMATAPGGTVLAGFAAAGALGTWFFFPFNSGFHNGNIQTWLNLLVLAALLAWLLDRRIAAGVLFGLVCIIKPQLSLIGLWALLRRDWRLAGGMAGVVAAFGLASLARYGLKVHFDYVELMQHLTRRGESYVGSHSVNGLLNRMLFLGPNVEFDPWHRSIIYDWRVHAGTVAASIALIVPALWPWRAHMPHGHAGGSEAARLSSTLDLSIALVAFTLASPVAYVPHFGFILPVFWIALLAVLRTAWRPGLALAVLAASYALASNYYVALNALADTPWNFLQSTMLYAAVALILLLFRLRAAALQVR